MLFWLMCTCWICRITIAQNLAFVGLSYSSPIRACGMGNLIPTFSFLLSIILRFPSAFIFLILHSSILIYTLSSFSRVVVTCTEIIHISNNPFSVFNQNSLLFWIVFRGEMNFFFFTKKLLKSKLSSFKNLFRLILILVSFC